MARRTILACVLLLIAPGPARPASQAVPDEKHKSFLYTVAKTYDPVAWLHGSDRFSPDAAIFLSDQNGQHRLVPAFAASADPAVSFDGQRVLFAGKAHTQDAWQIWETTLAGDQPRRVTAGAGDCIRPLYLPGDRFVYSRKVAGRFVIETADVAGGKPLALTYIPANALPADVLHDGRVLFEAGYPLGTNQTPELYTVYSDGSGVESYRCDHGTARHSARQASSGDIVFASAHGLSRFTSARAQEIRIVAPAGEYDGGIAEFAIDDYIVSWRGNSKTDFRLMRLTSGSRQLEPLPAQQGFNAVEPTPIAERRIPNRHPTGLHDWPNANLLCLNAYASKYPFAPGSIHSARLYTHDGDGSPRVLGTAPVERDGSFFVQVPSDRPLQIELLDSAGKSLKRESGFFWIRRGEQRGCVGCHAGPETAPENAVPMTLLKSTTPADLTGSAQSNAAGGH